MAERRRRRKITLMYKIVNNDASSYLRNLLPNRANETSTYNLRNNTDFVIPFSRLCSYESSFFPSVLKLWNDLDTQIRTLPTLLQFKFNIKTESDKIEDYITIGERKYNIILTRIRHRCSSFRAGLFDVNIILDPSCSCGAPSESAEHYFFESTSIMNKGICYFDIFNPNTDANFSILTSGSKNHDFGTNKAVILAVLKYIKYTHRFD